MDALIETLNLPPIIGLIIFTFLIAVFVAWKLAKIDSRTNYLLKAHSEEREANTKEHDKMESRLDRVENGLVHLSEGISEIRGYIHRDTK